MSYRDVFRIADKLAKKDKYAAIQIARGKVALDVRPALRGWEALTTMKGKL